MHVCSDSVFIPYLTNNERKANTSVIIYRKLQTFYNTLVALFSSVFVTFTSNANVKWARPAGLELYVFRSQLSLIKLQIVVRDIIYSKLFTFANIIMHFSSIKTPIITSNQRNDDDHHKYLYNKGFC